MLVFLNGDIVISINVKMNRLWMGYGSTQAKPTKEPCLSV